MLVPARIATLAMIVKTSKGSLHRTIKKGAIIQFTKILNAI
jgi:hypothetical protein